MNEAEEGEISKHKKRKRKKKKGMNRFFKTSPWPSFFRSFSSCEHCFHLWLSLPKSDLCEYKVCYVVPKDQKYGFCAYQTRNENESVATCT